MYTKWTYAIANPHATNSAPQLFPDSKDWVEASSFGREKHEEFIKCGSVRTEALPEVKVGEHSLFPHTAQDELLNCVHVASIIKGTISMIKGKNERIHHLFPSVIYVWNRYTLLRILSMIKSRHEIHPILFPK